MCNKEIRFSFCFLNSFFLLSLPLPPHRVQIRVISWSRLSSSGLASKGEEGETGSKGPLSLCICGECPADETKSKIFGRPRDLYHCTKVRVQRSSGNGTRSTTSDAPMGQQAGRRGAKGQDRECVSVNLELSSYFSFSLSLSLSSLFLSPLLRAPWEGGK